MVIFGLELFPFRQNRNGALDSRLTRFLRANRYPLRSKTLWPNMKTGSSDAGVRNLTNAEVRRAPIVL
jgi:hypothetical protein